MDDGGEEDVPWGLKDEERGGSWLRERKVMAPSVQ
jgi:hypothetical protein